ncbi:hypothetical protein CC78DRAFT_616278 [Lojkania enalia]|uniref:Prion-inhibition and propagation HeLo domain-containing protein n=1 Tax=Lojkania enalia TaxID=147567 RepID=A0A9P4N0G1_9PLEO|nr:hypothetical protein CC78DRAFT_616278 [Didymosphaeria enalia]
MVLTFHFILTVVDMPERCEKHSAWLSRLSIKHHELLAWAKASSVIEKGTEEMSLSLDADYLQLVPIISRIDITLRNFIKLNACYTELHPKGTTAEQREEVRTQEGDRILTLDSALTLVTLYDILSDKKCTRPSPEYEYQDGKPPQYGYRNGCP